MNVLAKRWRRSHFSWLRRAGIWIYHIKLARVRRVSSNNGAYFIKKRYARSRLLIATTNPLLRATHSTLWGLPEREWLDWEMQLAPLALGCTARVRGRTLILPALPGVRLSDYLANCNDLELKRRAVQCAARELYRLHQMDARCPSGVTSGEPRLFSHGDAHFRNVLYDAGVEQAIWFDFEAIHATPMTASRRHADDWRAFAFSTASAFSRLELPTFADLIASECCDESVRIELQTIVARLAHAPNLFHLAQAPLTFWHHQAVCTELRHALKTSPFRNK
jgi:hypothetical protein